MRLPASNALVPSICRRRKILRLYKQGHQLALFRTLGRVRSDPWGTAAVGGGPSRGRLGYIRCPCGHPTNRPDGCVGFVSHDPPRAGSPTTAVGRRRECRQPWFRPPGLTIYHSLLTCDPEQSLRGYHTNTSVAVKQNPPLRRLIPDGWTQIGHCRVRTCMRRPRHLIHVIPAKAGIQSVGWASAHADDSAIAEGQELQGSSSLPLTQTRPARMISHREYRGHRE